MWFTPIFRTVVLAYDLEDRRLPPYTGLIPSIPLYKKPLYCNKVTWDLESDRKTFGDGPLKDKYTGTLFKMEEKCTLEAVGELWMLGFGDSLDP